MKERQCDFIKKSFKKLALKWHPDKHETNARKKRAARKLNDAAEARDELNDRADCEAGSVNRERARAEKAKEEERNRQNWARGGGGGGGHHWGGHQHQYQRQRRGGGPGGGHWEF